MLAIYLYTHISTKTTWIWFVWANKLGKSQILNTYLDLIENYTKLEWCLAIAENHSVKQPRS